MTNLGRISFISAYNSTLWSITEACHGRNPNRLRTWQQELMQKPLRSAVYRVSPHGLLVCFLIVLKATRPGVAQPRVNLAPPYQSSTKKKKMHHRPFCWDVSSSQMRQSVSSWHKTILHTDDLKFLNLLCLPPKCWDYRLVYHVCLMCCWGSNPGHSVCQANSLPTKLHSLTPCKYNRKFKQSFMETTFNFYPYEKRSREREKQEWQRSMERLLHF